MLRTRLSRPGRSLLQLVVLLAILLSGLALLLPALLHAQGRANQQAAQNQLRQLGLAVHNLHDTYTQLPPAVGQLQNMTGSLHFFMLPYLEEGNLFQNARDGQKLLVWHNDTWSKPVRVLVDARDQSAPPNFVYQSWLATTTYPGNWLVFLEGNQRLANITDGVSNTLFFAQRYQLCNEAPTAWGYPSAYRWAPIFAQENQAKFQVAPRPEECDPSRPQSIGTLLQVGFADGSVRPISQHVSSQTWALLCDPRDGQRLGEDFNP